MRILLFPMFWMLWACGSNPEIWIEPKAPRTDVDLRVRGAESQAVDWILDGVVMHHGRSLSHAQTRKGDRWRAVLNSGTQGRLQSVSVKILNGVPGVSAQFLPDPPLGGQRPHVVVNTTDLDDDELDVVVWWSTGGEAWQVEPRHPQRGDVVTAKVEVSDGQDTTTFEVSSVAGNSVPVVDAVEISPESPTSVDTLEANVVATDGDGDELFFEMEWWVDGELVATGDTLGPQLRGAQVQVQARAADSQSVSRDLTSGVRVVQNGSPMIRTVVIEPSELTVTSRPHCAWSAFDPDGDAFSARVRWEVDGEVVGVGEDLEGDALSSGDRLTCTVLVSDSFRADSMRTSDEAEVQDSPPGAPWARIYPETPKPGESLICLVDARSVDPDEDLVTYEAAWQVDDVEFPDAHMTHHPRDTVTEGVILEGEVWRCTLTAMSGSLVSVSEAEATVAEPPGGNLLVLLADDLGVDKVGAYASHPDPPRTPVIDGLAAEGMLFRHAYAHPICSPTRSAMLTGRYARRTGIGAVIQVEFDAHHVPLEEVMVPEMLEASPWVYQAGAVGKWHLAGYGSETGLNHPLEQGFGYYAGSYGNPGASTVPGEHPTDYFYWEKVTNGVPAFTERYMTSDTVDDAIEQILAMSEPWFLYVAFNAPHDPFHLPPEGLHTYDIDETATPPARYAAMVEALDTELGRLLDAVPSDVLSRTTVLFAGDNGTPEQAITDPLSRTRSKGTLYEGGVNVPMIVSGPLVSVPGSESEGLVHVADVFATAAEMAGVRVHVPSTGLEPAADAVAIEIDGLSLLPYLRDADKPSLRRFGYSEKFQENGWGPYDVDVQTVRDNNFKLIRRTSGIEELYDLRGSGWDEGPNVLDSDQPEIREAAQRLSEELDLLLERMMSSG